jgi:hypothetical protein
MAISASASTGQARSQWAPSTVALMAFLASDGEMSAATSAGVMPAS